MNWNSFFYSYFSSKMNYVKTADSFFIPINNLRNSCCYHVALVQLLHTSKTFNRLVSTVNIDDEFYRLMLMPSIVYARVNESNYKEMYKEMKKAYNELYDKVVNESAKDGYSPHFLELNYILPIIYDLFPNDFSTILNEIGVDSIYLLQTEIQSDNVLEMYPFTKIEFAERMRGLNAKMIEWGHSNPSFSKSQKHSDVKGFILEVYPNAHSVDGGHALFLLHDRNTYYIFDDDSTIDYFYRYVQNRNANIAKICIHTNEDMSSLQQLWGGEVLTRRVNNRLELISWNGEAKPIASAFINLRINSQQTKNEVLRGGNMEPEQATPLDANEQLATCRSRCKLYLILLIIVIVLLAVDIAFGVFRALRKEKYDCPCNRR